MNNRHVYLILLAAGALPGQSPSPIFKTDTKLVQVDVVARDKNGPVSGLTKQDFTLLDNGKPQEIAVFSVKGSIKSAPAGVKPAPSVPLPPGAVSNRENSESDAAGTLTVILIDQKNLLVTDQQYAITRIVKFIQSRLAPRTESASAYSGRDGLRNPCKS